MIRREGGRMMVSGPVTLASVAGLLEEGRRHLEEGVRSVDLGEVTELDSALLALLLAWLRDAKSRKGEIGFVNLPESAQTIARLYGVYDLLPLQGTGAASQP
jgi:phospholipid transport system transporter-binding protein